MSANHQWKVVDERYSGNVFTDDHWYSTHIPRIVRVRTMQTTQKIRKTAQYCANFYAKLSFELLKTWNPVKHRYGEHRRTTAEVPRQKNWWNPQIADVSRNAPVPLTGDATALARRTKKNSKYAVDTPHAPQDLHIRCGFAKRAQGSRRGAPGIRHVRYVHRQILNMLKKNRRGIAEHTIRRSSAVNAQWKCRQRQACVESTQSICSSYANDRRNSAIDCVCACFALPWRSWKLCNCFGAHTRHTVGDIEAHHLRTGRFQCVFNTYVDACTAL